MAPSGDAYGQSLAIDRPHRLIQPVIDGGHHQLERGDVPAFVVSKAPRLAQQLYQRLGFGFQPAGFIVAAMHKQLGRANVRDKISGVDLRENGALPARRQAPCQITAR